MNHEDLERQLQSQHGPREDGYAPTGLPATLAAGRESESGTSRLVRTGLLVGVAVAGALTVAVVGSILSGRSPGVGGGGTTSAAPSASASPVATPGDGRCGNSDVTFSAEPWGGAAGSRGTTVTITLSPGQSACTLATLVMAQIDDADGTALVSGASVEPGGSVSLQPGGTFAIGVAWSNWCGSDPAVPVTLSLKLEGWPFWMPVNPPAGGLNPVPPCLGGAGSSLSVTGVQPQP